jgi:hypothetical protein
MHEGITWSPILGRAALQVRSDNIMWWACGFGPCTTTLYSETEIPSTSVSLENAVLFCFHFHQNYSISILQNSISIFIFAFHFHFSVKKSQTFHSTFVPTVKCIICSKYNNYRVRAWAMGAVTYTFPMNPHKQNCLEQLQRATGIQRRL